MSKLFEMIRKEEERQENNVELRASENFVSKDILNALNNENADYPIARSDLEKSAARMIQMAWRLGK